MSSILMCPVCRGTMREVAHLGVAIDTCTQCRGVWLDRGELEKIAAILSSGGGPAPAMAYRDDVRAPVPGPMPLRRRERDDDDDDDDDDDHRRRGGYGAQPQRRRSSFLDFFD